MSQAAAIQIDSGAKTQQRLMVEEDCRRQIAFTSSHTQDYLEPVLVMSRQRLRENARRFMAAMPRVRTHFAVKANPDPEILQIFKQEGTCFEVASIAEVDAMLELAVDMETVFYSNPIKSPASIAHAARAGMLWYSVDTPEEVTKIAAIKPDAKLYLRIEIGRAHV